MWELGGGTFLSKLLDVPLNADTINQMTVVMVSTLALCSLPTNVNYSFRILHAFIPGMSFSNESSHWTASMDKLIKTSLNCNFSNIGSIIADSHLFGLSQSVRHSGW